MPFHSEIIRQALAASRARQLKQEKNKVVVSSDDVQAVVNDVERDCLKRALERLPVNRQLIYWRSIEEEIREMHRAYYVQALLESKCAQITIGQS